MANKKVHITEEEIAEHIKHLNSVKKAFSDKQLFGKKIPDNYTGYALNFVSFCYEISQYINGKIVRVTPEIIETKDNCLVSFIERIKLMNDGTFSCELWEQKDSDEWDWHVVSGIYVADKSKEDLEAPFLP